MAAHSYGPLLLRAFFSLFLHAIMNKMRSAGEIAMQYEQPLKVLILAAEIVPFIKVGGLADVVGALPKSLKAQGHDIRLAMPRYGQVDVARFGLSTVLD